MDGAQLLASLPHRYPLLLIDRVLELRADRVIAIKNVALDEPWVAGHFPGAPVMPAVLQLEAMAQAGVILVTHAAPLEVMEMMVLVAINAARFRKPVVPGDQLRLELVVRRGGTLIELRGEIRVAGAVVSAADLVLARVDRTKLGGAGDRPRQVTANTGK